MVEPLVVATKVNKWFGPLHVLKDVDLTVEKGEVVVVLGPSGSGKSTLCRTLNRLEPIHSGTIEIDGVGLPEEGKALAKLRSDVGMVFQSFNLFAHKTVLQNVTLGPEKVRKMPRRKPASGPWRCSSEWASPRRPIATRPSCRAASNSELRSPERWPWTPR